MAVVINDVAREDDKLSSDPQSKKLECVLVSDLCVGELTKATHYHRESQVSRRCSKCESDEYGSKA